ncbi:MAG: neutral/alkaline non-lysosomal ceramidase N-terminal domain-containing protein [Opitutales bacterium]
MKAGFGRSDITPRLGVQLAGYGPYRNRPAREIVAPLHARALVLAQGRMRAVVLSLEICGTPRALADKIRAAAAGAARCRPGDVFLSVTHTHSCPAVGGMFGWGEADAMYVETLPARAAAAVRQASAALTEVEWRHAHVPCEGIAVNRETDAGFAMNADFAERMHPAWRPAHPEQTDPTVRVLAAYTGGKLVGLLHHFGCHPVVYGEKMAAIHGDYAGLAGLQLEQKHPGSVAVFLPGAIGDINPKLNHRGPRESRQALHAISRQYAAAVAQGLRTAQPMATGKFKAICRDVTLTRQKWPRAKVQRRIAELEKIFDVPGITDLPHTGGNPPLLTNGMEMARLEGLRALRANYRGGRAPNPPVRLHGLRLGPVALLGCGLELYHSLQAPILAGSPHPHTWAVSLVGGVGYAPDEAAHRRAGYSGDFVPLMCGELPFTRVYRELPDALVRLARDLGKD